MGAKLTSPKAPSMSPEKARLSSNVWLASRHFSFLYTPAMWEKIVTV
jgi:hypothetical protein